MKTPIQELIDIVKERKENENSIPFMWNGDIIKLAESLLEKEKEIMCQFQSDGQQTDFYVKYENSEDCFGKTFNTKEK
jgi:hypothetical protein